jgi:hypothetical protein
VENGVQDESKACAPPSPKHADVRWNNEIQEWFCAKCGHTSDHVTKEDALIELEQYECDLPDK